MIVRIQALQRQVAQNHTGCAAWLTLKLLLTRIDAAVADHNLTCEGSGLCSWDLAERVGGIDDHGQRRGDARCDGGANQVKCRRCRPSASAC